MKRIDIQPEQVFCPQPMYAIGTNNEDGSANFSVITWIGFSWNGSPHIMLGVGGSKRTVDNILRDGLFSANLVSGDMLWLCDYFGSSHGRAGPKDRFPHAHSRGSVLAVPVLEQCRWAFECEVSKTVELDGSHIFIARVANIQIAEDLRDMDREMIDLLRLDPVLYAPYNYYALGRRLGACGEWEQHLPS
jgi:flavin reductase (DIM6/NTAB) family NADH-FMN oxidoreductase RutF